MNGTIDDIETGPDRGINRSGKALGRRSGKQIDGLYRTAGIFIGE